MLETRKAQELDVVELTEDLPEYGLKKGERGAVITAFDEPREAYDLEFVDESGESRFAYSVRPEQIVNIEHVAREAFDQGVKFVKDGKPIEAEQAFQRAIEIKPGYIAVLHNLIIRDLWKSEDWSTMIVALRMVLRLNPDYEENGYNLAVFARNNLAMSYSNLGVQLARQGNDSMALQYFDIALGVGPSQEGASLIRRNIVKAYTSLGIQCCDKGDYLASVGHMRFACEVDLNQTTRHNFGLALVYLAKSYIAQHNFENALTILEHAVDLGVVIPRWKEINKLAFANSDQLGEALQSLGVEAEFIPTPPMQQQEFQTAA
jgi:tetratricopeptide (TPR) repeat protein